MKNCSPWEDSCWRSPWRTVSGGRDPTLEQGKSVRSPPPEEEGAAETTPMGKHYQQVNGSDPYPILRTGEATSVLLRPVLGSPVQDSHEYTGEAERAGTVQPEEEKAQEDLSKVYNDLMQGSKEDRARLSSVVLSDRTRGTGHKLK
ncbi:hypothetical protein QYF61_008304 [Mycteria americana]|uniref:Uncharacterized protein n=1 Tax=Mycteria americana TaxID=33587 RepID=A0AAN7N9A7_MYCAM|nr:hypothetical protein QYF61_008304 [Mycteria americana]